MKIKKTALEKDLEAVKESIKALEEQSRSIGDSSVRSAMAIEEQNRIIAEKKRRWKARAAGQRISTGRYPLHRLRTLKRNGSLWRYARR